MKIQYCSDLHLEFELNSQFLRNYPIEPQADVLILAGDITYLRQDFYRHWFFDYVSQHWKTVYWLPGNHEFYCGIDVLSYDFSKPIAIRPNVFLLNNSTIELDGVHLIFSTLWSRIEKKNAVYIEKNVSDFECIIYDGSRLSATTFNRLHTEAVTFLKTEIKRLRKQTKIIVTHHLPSLHCNALEFAGSKLNQAFCTNLSSFVETCGANYWIYGHSHRNMPEISIGQTILLTNQLGYMQLDENKGYRTDASFDICRISV